MIDLMLRFADEADWLSTNLTPDEALLIEVVGNIIESGGMMTPLGLPDVLPPPGYHINVRCLDGRDLSALDPYVVTPAEPVRIWFGAI